MPIAVMTEAEPLIDLTQARARSFAIQAQITPAKRAGAFNSPAQQGGRNDAATKLPAHSKAMHECRFSFRHVRPEQSVFEFEFDCADDFAIPFGNVEKSLGDIV